MHIGCFWLVLDMQKSYWVSGHFHLNCLVKNGMKSLAYTIVGVRWSVSDLVMAFFRSWGWSQQFHLYRVACLMRIPMSKYSCHFILHHVVVDDLWFYQHLGSNLRRLNIWAQRRKRNCCVINHLGTDNVVEVSIGGLLLGMMLQKHWHG